MFPDFANFLNGLPIIGSWGHCPGPSFVKTELWGTGGDVREKTVASFSWLKEYLSSCHVFP